MKEKDHETFVGVAFTVPMLQRLFDKMMTLQSILSEDGGSSLTHMDILSKLEPVLAHRYKKGFHAIPPSKGANVFQRFMAVDGSTYLQGKKSLHHVHDVFTTSTSFELFLTSLDIPTKTEMLDVIRNGKHLGPDGALEEMSRIINTSDQQLIDMSTNDFKNLTHKERGNLLKNLDFNTMKITTQKAWMKVLLDTKDHRYLFFRNCQLLKTKSFDSKHNKSLDVRNLTILEIINCDNVDDQVGSFVGTTRFGTAIFQDGEGLSKWKSFQHINGESLHFDYPQLIGYYQLFQFVCRQYGGAFSAPFQGSSLFTTQNHLSCFGQTPFIVFESFAFVE
jgi:hypothetical protein